MSSKKVNGKNQATKKMVRITMEVKKEIVVKYEGGMRIRDLAAAYRMPRTTISTIVKNKDVIKSANVAKGVKSITKQRSGTLEHVEKLLLIWIQEKQFAGDSLSESMICEKAKLLHADLLKNKAGTSQGSEVFKASHGWFDNFKKRTGIYSVAKHGEETGADKDVAHDFVTEFEEFAETEDHVSRQACNDNPVVQPTDQRVINNFKKLYTKALYQRCFEATSDTKLTLRDFWKDHFTIVHCISLIDKAWKEVSYRRTNSAWRNLRPEAATEKDFDGVSMAEDILSLGRSMGLDVGGDGDGEELEEGRRKETTTEELRKLQEEEHKTEMDTLSSGSEEIEEAPTSLIEEIFAKWSDVRKFAEKYHPDKVETSRNSAVWNDQTMSHFQSILRKRQKQSSLHRLLANIKPDDPQPGPSREKRQEIEN